MTRQTEIALNEVQKLQISEFDDFFSNLLQQTADKFGIIYQMPNKNTENIWFVSAYPKEHLFLKSQQKPQKRIWKNIGKIDLKNSLDEVNVRDFAYQE